MGPLVYTLEFSESWNFFFAFVLGIGFGFALEQAGFSSSRRLAGMFYGYDTTVLKVFFTAAIVAAVGLLFMKQFNLIDLSLVYINPLFPAAAIVGGVIMGMGFITGGFCPGTGICAAAIGKIDALVFLLGILIGVFIFGESYSFWKPLYLHGSGEPITISESIGLKDAVFLFLLIIMAVFMFWIAEKAEAKYARKDISDAI
jgi:uncharacterized protein